MCSSLYLIGTIVILWFINHAGGCVQHSFLVQRIYFTLWFTQVYKVLTGSPADKDGRIRKGDRILSINGKSMKGLTHRESLAILKVRKVKRIRTRLLDESVDYRFQNMILIFLLFVRRRLGPKWYWSYPDANRILQSNHQLVCLSRST